MNDIELAERIQEVRRLCGGERADVENVCRMILPWSPKATNCALAQMVLEIRAGATEIEIVGEDWEADDVGL